jgi:hypothetical protein
MVTKTENYRYLSRDDRDPETETTEIETSRDRDKPRPRLAETETDRDRPRPRLAETGRDPRPPETERLGLGTPLAINGRLLPDKGLFNLEVNVFE